MKVCLFVDCISPHQIPLGRMLCARIGREHFRYIYENELSIDRKEMGWSECGPEWCIASGTTEGIDWIHNADIVLSGIRDIALFVERVNKGKITYYMSERWFKPPFGILRLCHPRFFRMAWRLFSLLMRGNGHFQYLPIGFWAAKDMARLVELFNGDVRCLFRTPKVDFEKMPMGEIYGYPWMRMWGYFVEASKIFSVHSVRRNMVSPLRVLWVGRMLSWKRVDTIIKAVGSCLAKMPVELTIVGDGPECGKLRRLAKQRLGDNLEGFHMRDSVAVGEVRELMRQNDVYVLSSDGYEGWGAVVSEALEEKMIVLGTYEAGASATILPKTNLFHAGDDKALSEMLLYVRKLDKHSFLWTAQYAANRLLDHL